MVITTEDVLSQQANTNGEKFSKSNFILVSTVLRVAEWLFNLQICRLFAAVVGSMQGYPIWGDGIDCQYALCPHTQYIQTHHFGGKETIPP